MASDPHVYTLHKPLRKKVLRRRVVVSGLLQQYQADLLSVINIKKFNDGYCFILTCIDVFSKFAYAAPLKIKWLPVFCLRSVSFSRNKRQSTCKQTQEQNFGTSQCKNF